MYSLISLTFFVFSLINSGSYVAGQTRIIGGKPAAQGMFPYQVLLQILIAEKVYDYGNYYSRKATSSCGGSLISESFVITAAHCLKHRKPLNYNYKGELEQSLNETVTAERLELFLGGVNLLEESKGNYQNVQYWNLNGSNFIIHPQFHYSATESDPVNSYNDVALIHLPTPAKLNGLVRPIQLPTQALNDLMSGNATVIGFGMHNMPQAPSVLSEDDVLRYVNVDIIPNEECQSSQTTEICIRGKRKNTSVGVCAGDSGGPLIYKSYGIDTIIGIVSYGYDCTDGSPHYFTRVTKYLDWIHKIMKDKHYI